MKTTKKINGVTAKIEIEKDAKRSKKKMRNLIKKIKQLFFLPSNWYEYYY